VEQAADRLPVKVATAYGLALTFERATECLTAVKPRTAEPATASPQIQRTGPR